MKEILQSSLPYDPLAKRPLPGIAPLDMADWLDIDDAYADQMALRRALLDARLADVMQLVPEALEAAQEVLRLTLEYLRETPEFSLSEQTVHCPDGCAVSLDWQRPLFTLGHILQEDICLLQKHGNEHVLSGAVLCFPASWTLAEKFMRPLTLIHSPVPEYDANIAKRVQRLFDGVRVDRPLWRKNALWYDSPKLFTPQREAAPRDPVTATSGAYLRSERQVIFRLPETDAVVFSIHTYMLRRDTLPKPQ